MKRTANSGVPDADGIAPFRSRFAIEACMNVHLKASEWKVYNQLHDLECRSGSTHTLKSSAHSWAVLVDSSLERCTDCSKMLGKQAHLYVLEIGRCSIGRWMLLLLLCRDLQHLCNNYQLAG